MHEAARPGKQGALYTRGEGLRNAEEVEVQAPANRISRLCYDRKRRAQIRLQYLAPEARPTLSNNRTSSAPCPMSTVRLA